MKNYTVLHLHSMLSNAFTTIDSVTHYKDYIKLAKESGMTSIAFSEHGNFLSWVNKKQYCDEVGIKYIHAIEGYVTLSTEEKKRDNYHVLLIAKNWDAVKELNTAFSADLACNRKDGHFYFAPRITYEELKSFSDNVIISTACLGGILNSEDAELERDFIEFMKKNKHRCYLEIQHHKVDSQILYNQKLYEVHRQTGIPLVACTDTHALNAKHLKGRDVLQKSKSILFENEAGWDLSFKTYDELVKAFTNQNSLPMDVVIEAIQNTNVIAESIESFSLDRSYKYPKLYKNPNKVFKAKVLEGFYERGIDKYPNTEDYKNRLNYEFGVMKKLGVIDYMLLEEDIKSAGRKEGIFPGPSRGSISGSLNAYLLNITDVDSLKFNMNFERLFSPNKISLADVDTDWPPSQRDWVKQYVYNKHGLYCAEIVTFNTIAIKGAIRDVCRTFNIDLGTVGEMCSTIETQEDKWRNEYPEIFEYVDLLIGVVVSIGTHPSATIVSPMPLDDILGTFTLSTCDYPVAQVNMKEVDGLNFVKLDILGLDNIEVINKTCALAGIPRLTMDNFDMEDQSLYDEIMKSSIQIFQWESDSAYAYYKQLFSKGTIEKIKQLNPNVKLVDLLSIGNGAIRPAGESYRYSLAKGEFYENGHEALDKFLSPTLGRLVFQEQIIEFLNKFCGFTMGEADIVRRGFAKKTGTEEFMPRIIDGFVKTMQEQYNTSKSEAEEIVKSFIQVIEDASSYLFSSNHSVPYSAIGLMCAYLRHYYTLEFVATALNVCKSNQDKTTRVFEFINGFTDIKVESIKFRHSEADYSINKETNTIYKGMSSIKHLNELIAQELYSLKDNQYESFAELLVDIKGCSVNSRQLEILILLGFFDEFGKAKKLLKTVEVFNTFYGKKQMSKEKINPEYKSIIEQFSTQTEKQYKLVDTTSIIKSISETIPDKDIGVQQKVQHELEYLGYAQTLVSELPDSYAIVTIIEQSFSNKFITLHRLAKGGTEKIKVRGKAFDNNEFVVGDIIVTNEIAEEKRKRKIDGQWVNIDEVELILKKWEVIRK